MGLGKQLILYIGCETLVEAQIEAQIEGVSGLLFTFKCQGGPIGSSRPLVLLDGSNDLKIRKL